MVIIELLLPRPEIKIDFDFIDGVGECLIDEYSFNLPSIEEAWNLLDGIRQHSCPIRAFGVSSVDDSAMVEVDLKLVVCPEKEAMEDWLHEYLMGNRDSGLVGVRVVKGKRELPPYIKAEKISGGLPARFDD